MFKPKILTALKGYTKETFVSDLTAGTIVGIVALPLAIAFAIASGVSPDKGIITAVIAGFIISAFGGSRVQIGGPTGAFIVIVYGILQEYGMDGLIIATVMAGFILIIMGLAKFGTVIKFIPHPVIVGFTSGIGLIIFSTQIKDLLGLSMQSVPSEFIEKWIAYSGAFNTANLYSFAVGGASLLIMMFWGKINKTLPGSLIALILSTLAVSLFNLPVETIGSRFGEIPSSLPMPVFPHLDFGTIRHLIEPATTIAILAAIESLLSAVVADGMIGSRHNSNTELIAQGIANIASPLFGGIPATGAIARTVTNIKNGGRTPVAGIVHAIVLLLIMMFFGSYAKLVPMPALAAILIIVSYNMFEWRSFAAVLKSPRSDVLVLLTTFGLTVIFDLTVAIEVGMVLAVFLFMRRMALVTNVGILTKDMQDIDDEAIDPNSISNKHIPDGVEVYEINGPFFFGAASKFKEAMSKIGKKPLIRIIRMRNVPAIDSTGIHLLEEVYHDSKKENITVILSGVHAQPYRAIEQAGFAAVIGEDNMHGNIDDALTRARQLLSEHSKK